MEWKKVSDEIPSTSGFYLVYDSTRGAVVRHFNDYHDCWDDEDADDYYTDSVGGKITHWMELPAMPIDN